MRCTTIMVLFLWPSAATLSADDGRKVSVTLKLLAGGEAAGLVSEYDDQGLVLLQQGIPKTICWDIVTTNSAYQARRKILTSARGSEKNLTAEDHFQLGLFLARRNEYSSATAEFNKAKARDPSYEARIQQAWREIRRAKEQNKPQNNDRMIPQQNQTDDPGVIGGGQAAEDDPRYLKFTEDEHRRAVQLYREFGEKVREQLAPDLVLLETRNFLIWTDWPESTRNQIPDWAEQLYSAMCDQFGFPRDTPIWRGKCPIFCFASESRYQKFADELDDYNAASALAYTRTMSNGYAHVVLRRLGNKPAEIDQFATTMVHEASHAFMHCYQSPRKLPAWLEEGFAEYISEQVMGPRCRSGENAALLGRYYAQNNLTIAPLFTFTDSPPGEWYPIAQSVVTYLISRDREAFVRLLQDLKKGDSVEDTLARHYKGLSTRTLEVQWRAWASQK
ncbi:MAG: hypothetical protein HJJLKODD_02376 [Phycisphaerae bacterium]|nr:hypothetical protein [Phycisphaerae bacterium]